MMPELDLKRQIGPMPLYLWVVGAGVVGLVIYRFVKSRKGTSSGGGGTNLGQGTQFSSSTTSTGTDAAGNQVSTNYNAQGNGFLPGVLTFGAGPMPVSGGDVYVNYPAPPTTPPTTPTNDDQWPEAYGGREIQEIQKLVGQQGYTQQIVDDVKAAYDATVAHYGQEYADVQHYSYLGPGNVQAIPRHVTATTQISRDLPSNPKWGDIAPQATQNLPSGGNPGTARPPYQTTQTPVVSPR